MVKDVNDLYYIKQKIGNACGTIGLIHALCNNIDKLDIDSKYALWTEHCEPASWRGKVKKRFKNYYVI